ncbi:early nodulin-like protein 20 [Rhynchospora pubera]|uniref:Early nodulin-like protein 20 n=1 Tax=Rhynchospora pubera TaxID=906938 RepID=A0AAV8DZL9_9POAL|nr:early nodulin-like protein 20 [Rhynchospora pubera]KAJ4778754.1 early nodulin-like protein 20 [Rhynchospora pubera]KAJ4785633.1 early nodulin-like protein 20 [Rhynchospora pubera]
MAIYSHCTSAKLLLLLLFLAWRADPSAATDHIVGGDLGWNPNINYSSWSHNQTFLVGDLISFRYQKHTYNVFEVNKTGYDNCTMDGYAGNWTSGKDFIPLNKPQMYYFICNGFCFGGMKVSVVVRPLPANATAPTKALAARGSAVEKSMAVRRVGDLVVSLVFAVVIGLGMM